MGLAVLILHPLAHLPNTIQSTVASKLRAMTLNQMTLRSFRNPEFWLMGLSGLLVSILITLSWRTDEVDHLGMVILFCLAIASLLQERKETLTFNSGILPTIVGILFITWVLLYSLSTPEAYSNFIRIAPFIGGLGLALIASGFRGIQQFWRELTILFFLGIPRVLVALTYDISPITAKFSAFILWYGGFDVTRDDVFIRLPGGAVEVYSGCSGLESMSYLLGLSVIALVMFPLSRMKQMILPIVAIATGFIVNGIRVALMAILAASQNKPAFDYWHEGDGSMLFAVTAVLVFGLICFILMRQPANPSLTDNNGGI